MSRSGQLANQMPPVSFSQVFTDGSQASVSDKKEPGITTLFWNPSSKEPGITTLFWNSYLGGMSQNCCFGISTLADQWHLLFLSCRDLSLGTEW